MLCHMLLAVSSVLSWPGRQEARSPGQAQAGLWAMMGGRVLFSLLIDFSQFYVLFVNLELPDVQAGFRKDRGIRDQIAHLLDHRKS